MTEPNITWRLVLRRLLPWLVAVLVVVLLLRKYSLGTIVGHLQVEGAWTLVPLAAILAVASLLLMGTADWLVVRSNLGRLPWNTMIRGRGGVSFISAASYGAGQGSYGLWLARITGTKLTTATGTIAYLMLCDLGAVCLVATVGLWLTSLPIASELRWLVLFFAPLIASVLVIIALVSPVVAPKTRNLGGSGWRGTVARWLGLLFEPWGNVRATAYLASLGFRIANILVSAVLWYIAARALHIRAPLSAFFAYIPIIYLIGSLPVNVGPFGVVQVAWLRFFGAYMADEQVIALQVVFGTLLVLGFALRGVPFVGRVLREIAGNSLEATTHPKSG